MRTVCSLEGIGICPETAVCFDCLATLRKQGIIFTDLDTAILVYADLVRPNLMTRAVLPGEGKFAALTKAMFQSPCRREGMNLERIELSTTAFRRPCPVRW